MNARYLLQIAFLFLCSTYSNAQNTLDNIGLTSSTPANVAFSLRQLSSTYVGPLVRIKVGTSFYDVYPDTTTKNFSLSSKISAAIVTYNASVAVANANALSTIITGSSDATVAIWYDQSGNGVNVLTSSSLGPKIINQGSILLMYGKPTVYFAGAISNSIPLVSSATVNYSTQQTATVNAVAQNIGSISNISGIYSTGLSGGWGLNYDPTASAPGYWLDGSGCNQAFSGATSTTPKIVTGFLNKSTNSSIIYENSVLKGTKTMTCAIDNGSTDKICIGIRAENGGTRKFDGNISEVILFPSILSNTNQNLLETNQNTTYFSPFVTITSSASSNSICTGTNVTFTANAQNFSSTPTYQWYKNNVAISGAISSTYSTTSLANNDIINVSCSNSSNIVNDTSLALWLDAGNTTSYSGTGTTWNDISGNNKNATLTSDQSYSSADGGIIQFNGGQNAVSMPLVSNKTTDVTMQTWVHLDANTIGPFFKNGSNNGYVFGTGNNANEFGVGNKATMLFAGTRWISQTNTFYGYGWKLVTMTINSSGVPSMYINNSLVPGTTTGTNAGVPTTGTYLGRNVGDDGTTSPKFNGKMGAAYFYTKALTLAEITQNYNALATRFGLSSSNNFISNSISTTVNALPSATISISGDSCINKTTLSTTSGLTSYAWYKDNVAVPGATNNSYFPTSAGDYKVVVSNGTCNATSTSTTITNCGVTANGSMSILETSTTLVSKDGAINSGKGIDERGSIITKPIYYGTVTTGTGRIWLDRNLGASRVATSATDTQAFGDYYQWGRPADGHQSQYITNNNSTGFTNTKSTTSVPPNGLWIQPNDGSEDWLITANNTLWVGANPVNNPCPLGFRIPTLSEWQAEQALFTSNNSNGAFNYSLKLTMPGWLENFDNNGASFIAKASGGFYLTQTASSNGSVQYFGINGSNVWNDTNLSKRRGLSCRCIKN
jgi:hypothetical protein